MTSPVLHYDATRPAKRFYYGWINLGVAALAMVATLPGRTQGIGLITEPLLADLKISPTHFAALNLWATLIGASFCLATGPLIDRFGSRVILLLTTLALAASVYCMSAVTTPTGLLIALTLTRGFGQSALSVVSLTIVGKWFSRKLPLAMAVYSIAIGIGFVAAFPGVGFAVMRSSWRITWLVMAITLVAALAPLAWLLVRRTPESIGLQVDGDADTAGSTPTPAPPDTAGHTLPAALATPAFWVLAISSAAFGLISSGLMLFNQAVLTEHGVNNTTVLAVLGVITLAGLAFNFLGGYLAERWPLGRLMGGAMFLLAGALFALPLARGPLLVYSYAVAMGAAAGIVTVVFFVCWGKLFGRRSLGAIQGAAQLLTVLSSAAGPLLLAESTRRTGSSTPLLFTLAPAVAVLGVACMLIPLPRQPDSI